jgi:hypothetical protein
MTAIAGSLSVKRGVLVAVAALWLLLSYFAGGGVAGLGYGTVWLVLVWLAIWLVVRGFRAAGITRALAVGWRQGEAVRAARVARKETRKLMLEESTEQPTGVRAFEHRLAGVERELMEEERTRATKAATTTTSGGREVSPKAVKRAVLTIAVVGWIIFAIVLEGPMGLIGGPLGVLLIWAFIRKVKAAGQPRVVSVTATPRREPIPERVRHEVWRRDQGRCVDCGSRERLEYDHIIAVVRGGSNTARNIELRCERCNRRKGAKV